MITRMVMAGAMVRKPDYMDIGARLLARCSDFRIKGTSLGKVLKLMGRLDKGMERAY